jgi:hypothetical protein
MSYRHFIAIMASTILSYHPLFASSDVKIQNEIYIIKNAASACSGNHYRIVKLAKKNIFCIVGPIIEENVNNFTENKNKIDYVFSDTNGGSGSMAMKIGRKIFADRAKLIVGGLCYSACANYLVPSSSAVIVSRLGVIGMHGSALRGIIEYTSAIVLPRDGGKISSADSVRSEFARYRDTVLREEQEFFQYILKDDAYVTRYTEIMRGFRLKNQAPCNISGNKMLFLDRQYLNEFGINVGGWENEGDYEAQLKELNKSRPNTIVLLGLNGIPINVANQKGTCSIN